MGQKAKNAGKKASKVCYKEADAKSCKGMSLLATALSWEKLSEIDKLLLFDKANQICAKQTRAYTKLSFD